MYSDEQYRKALEVYEETKSVTKAMTILGHPAYRQTLFGAGENRQMVILARR